MKFRSRSFLCLLSLGSLLASCHSPVPSDVDLDRAYKYAQLAAQKEIAELDRRRARGEITAEEYVRVKREIMDGVAARANEYVLNQTALVQSQRQASGLPTPETPQDITVAQAGTLSTGTARHIFNDSGGADGTNSGLGFLPGGSIGIGTMGYGGVVSGGPVQAVAVAPVAAPAVVAPPTPTGVGAGRVNSPGSTPTGAGAGTGATGGKGGK